MRLLWIVLAVFGSVAALPKSSSRTEQLKQILSGPYTPKVADTIEGIVLEAIEDMRETMLTGSDTIPVLDPLEIEHIFVNDEILPLPGAEVTIKDLSMKNLASFVVNDLTVTRTSLLLQRYRFEFDGDVPNIDVNVGNYDMSINAMGFHIFGKGDAKFNVVKPRVQANLLIAPRISISGIFLNLLECQIKFSLGDFQANITGMFNDEGVSAFVSLFLQNLTRELLDFYENDINDFLSTTVHEAANDFLSDFDIGSILG